MKSSIYKIDLNENKNDIAKNTIQLLRAAILTEKKKSMRDLTDNEILVIISKERKKRYDSLCQFESANREDLVIHVGDEHDDMIPENFTPLRLVFNYVNKRPMTYHGKCIECGNPTDRPDCTQTYDW